LANLEGILIQDNAMKKIYYGPIIIFVILAAILVMHELVQGRSKYYSIMDSRARQIADVVKAYRQWGASVGHIYADRDNVQPNPYLKWHTLRDQETDSLHLTMVNPAYMTRLVSEILNAKKGVKLRIVSTNPFNPGNMASPWEEAALKNLKSEKDEYSEPYSKGLQEISYRYLKPLYVEKPCRKCHARQGYKVGDLIGGISVEIPSDQVLKLLLKDTLSKVTTYLIISVLLLVVIIYLLKKIYLSNVERENTINELNIEIERRKKSESVIVAQTRIVSQSEMLQYVAHHWRQPLNIISLTLQEIRDLFKEDNDLDSSVLIDIDLSLEKIQELSSSIDHFSSKITQLSEESEVFSIKSIIVDVLNIMEPMSIQDGIKVWVRCYDAENLKDECICSYQNMNKRECVKEDLFINGSERNFNHIFMAMFKNAYEAVQEKYKKTGERKDGFICVTVGKNEETLVISVRDNGIGISEENKPKVFEPYFTTKGFEQGKGLGLYIAKGLAEQFDDGALVIEVTDEYTEITFRVETANH